MNVEGNLSFKSGVIRGSLKSDSGTGTSIEAPTTHSSKSSSASTTSSSCARESLGRTPESSYGDLTMLDIEAGSQTQRLRRQSRRISELIAMKTELYDLDPVTPCPLKDSKLQNDPETSGLKYWYSEINAAHEHGGDYRKRLDAAMRAALGSFTVFSVLVFPHQQILGAVWIGNIFMMTNINNNFGSSLISVKAVGRSIVLTTAFAWPLGYFLHMLPTTQACIVLPFVVFIASFLIMSCPQLAARNLMILVMYMVVATNVREVIKWWEPLGWVATYLLGLLVSVLVNLLPTQNLAMKATSSHISNLEKDLTMLLLQCKAYADNTAHAPGISRAAIAGIELLHSRIIRSVKALKAEISATKEELWWTCKSAASQDLHEWIDGAEKLLPPLKSLRMALTQRVIGEEYSLYSPTLREAKHIIKEEIGESRDRMVDSMIAAVAICNAWADPSTRHIILPDVNDELRESIYECRRAFQRAMGKAAAKLGSNPQQNTPIFAHLSRRMSAFNAMFELADALLLHLEQHMFEAEQEIKHTFSRKKHSSSAKEHISSAVVYNFVLSLAKFCTLPWLWHSPDSFRLAMKTSVGMVFASLFVSIPFLWNIAKPFGVWPGLTIASVSLANTGSSFNKAADRLFGTLLAAAYALLVSDLFPGNKDYVKVPAIAIFTWIVIYLKTSQHSYQYTYAATSIGSMLYGSVKNSFNIAGYIPKRIELIFVGVVIFTVVELLLFPRSSRKMVEELGFKYFLSMRDFLKQAQACSQRMDDYITSQNENRMNSPGFFNDTSDVFDLDRLANCHRALKVQSTNMKKELESGLQEPHVGLSLQLDPEGFRGLAKEQGDCEIQALLLLKSMRQLADFCREEGHPIREMNWPAVQTKFLRDLFEKTAYACEWLQAAFPDGRLRPQDGNAVMAVTAGATFRGFEDSSLRTISGWSDTYSTYLQQVHGGVYTASDDQDIRSIMTSGVTTTCIIELGRHMMNSGSCIEKIAQKFPVSSSSSSSSIPSS